MMAETRRVVASGVFQFTLSLGGMVEVEVEVFFGGVVVCVLRCETEAERKTSALRGVMVQRCAR